MMDALGAPQSVLVLGGSSEIAMATVRRAVELASGDFWIEGEVSECFELEGELKKAFGFKDAVVVPEPTSDTPAAGGTRSAGRSTSPRC